MPESDVTKMKVADLKRELKVRGLATTGNKTELQDRLQTALLDGDISLEDSAITNEDALLDEEDAVLTDEEESPIAADENELLKSPTSTPTVSELASPLDETTSNKPNTGDTNTTTNTNKISLKRKSSHTTDGEKSNSDAKEVGDASNTAKENTEPPKDKVIKMSERNPITTIDLTADKKVAPKTNNGTITITDDEPVSVKKVVQLSQMERLELRAKKFGLGKNTTTATAAAPPPATTTTIASTNKTKINAKLSSDIGVVSDAKQIEMLKKRAERFGCVVSSKMAQIDAAERLQKRKERFGAGNTAAAGGGGTAKGNDVWAEKARARLERFKGTPTITPTTTDKKVAITANNESAEDVDVKKEPEPIISSTPTSAPATSVASN